MLRSSFLEKNLKDYNNKCVFCRKLLNKTDDLGYIKTKRKSYLFYHQACYIDYSAACEKRQVLARGIN